MKHTPATPLPWRVALSITKDSVDGQQGIWAGKRGIADVYGYPANAAYIAHAANAYPRLVEALRKVLSMHCSQGGEYRDRIKAMPEARALLRELGEGT